MANRQKNICVIHCACPHRTTTAIHRSLRQRMAEPIESLVITFFETPVLAVRSPDGTILLAIRDLCAATGLDFSSQLRRLRRDIDLRDGVQPFRVVTAGGPQEQEFLI